MDYWSEFLPLLPYIAIAFYTLAAVCAAREVMWSRTSQGSIAWLISLFFLPFPTVPLYFVFAWKHFGGYATIQRERGNFEDDIQSRHGAMVDHAANEQWPVHTRIAPLPFLKGNKSHLLIDGEATFASILEGIRGAKDTILFQFFIVRDDALGEKIADALIERAQANVQIFFLYDDIGSRTLSNAYISRLKSAGIFISGFNKRHRLLRMLGPMRLNYRNHRKIVVIDHDTCWVGGHNVGVEYLGQDKHFGHWRDTHVKVTGPAALAASLSFAEDWQWATGYPLELDPPKDINTHEGEPILVMPTGPADPLEDCAIAFVETISRARERLWIVSPYFVPGREVLTSLYAAALRGVDVRILLPRKADHRLVWLASYAHADDLASHGIKVYRYLEGFLHQKVVLVDNVLASIGTVNFDNRSFNINFEITLWFTGKETIQETASMLERDFNDARRTDSLELYNRPYLFRVLAQAARLFSPVL
ncbi:cardiolipin synthase [Flexibacterium corallicola]|uniref:cardiolipin synthase n=1 Tax=Flexibacterium corallicola TaxID=3037259 RepID=UPI00286EC22E|nr:cardiolipin synthase [Pseudovibrio sp. M1P-2-3]